MKKMFAALLVLSFLICAVGCAETLRVASSIDFPPYEFYDDATGEIVGIEIEIMDIIAKDLGMDLEVTDTMFDSIIATVVSGKADIGVSGFTVTEERKQTVDFTDTYTEAMQAILIPDGSPIASVDDLFNPDNAFKIGVQQGTTGDLYITDDVEANGLKHTVERFNKYGDAVAALISGKLDCMIVDGQVAIAFADVNETLSVLDTAYALEEYAFCLAKENPLYDAINGELQKLIEDGTVQAIIDRYIVSD